MVKRYSLIIFILVMTSCFKSSKDNHERFFKGPDATSGKKPVVLVVENTDQVSFNNQVMHYSELPGYISNINFESNFILISANTEICFERLDKVLKILHKNETIIVRYDTSLRISSEIDQNK